MSHKVPPKFIKGDDYEKWKKKLKIWQSLTDLKKGQQGPAIFMVLEEEAQEALLEIPEGDIAKENGVQTVLEKLDILYLKDKTQCAFEALEEFESFKRQSGIGIAEFCNQFDLLYNKTRNYGTVLSTDVLAYRLLKSASLTKEQEQLVKATIGELNYAAMQTQLKRIHVDVGTARSTDSKEELEVEHETLYARGGGRYRHRGSYQRGGRGGYRRPTDSSDAKEGARSRQKFPNQKGCFTCHSIFHWAKDCPDKYTTMQVEHKEPTDEVFHATLFQSDDDNPTLLGETFNHAVIDCGAAKTVCGMTWWECYVDTLDEKERREVNSYPGKSIFKFGDGKEVRSNKLVTFPAIIGKIKVKIVCDVVECEIPLLLSKDSLKKANAELNFFNDSITLLGQQVELTVTKSGHYAVRLRTNVEEIALTSISNLSDQQTAEKLHRQFAHPTATKLKKLVQDSGQKNTKNLLKEIDQVTDHCEVCKKFKKPKPRPTVGLPMATMFNECVAMDLKKFGECQLFHMIDHATRLSACAAIKDKKPQTIIKEMFRRWISIYGTPQKFLSDNGGEFSNEEVRVLCENLNINVKTTAAESPWSNGLCERHNMVIASMVTKVMADTGCGLEMAICWSVNAKNSLQNVHGFSPYQLVFGKNPALPNVNDSKPPALGVKEEELTIRIIRENLNALHGARQAYIASENSEKIKRALAHQVRTSGDIKYVTGDRVYYRRRIDKSWRGPATVLGTDGQQVLVKHGGVYVRVHPCRLCLENNSKDKEENVASNLEPRETRSPPDELTNSVVQEPETYSSGENHAESDEGEDPREETEDEVANMDVDTNEINHRNGNEGQKIATALRRLMPYNSVGAKEVLTTVEKEQEKQKILKAKDDELKKLVHYDVYDWVKDTGQDTISCKWITATKKDDTGEKVKARLVARGFEEELHEKKESPTCSREALRMVYMVAATMSWVLQTMDMTSAFLQGNKIDRDVYIKPPREAKREGMLWKLKRCLYGLVDAPRSWYTRVTEEMIRLGGVVSIYDKCLFMWHENNKLIGVLITHVDDFQYCGSEEWKMTVVEELKNTFDVSREEKQDFKFIGVEIQQKPTGVYVNQNDYCAELIEIEIGTQRKLQTSKSLNEKEKKDLKMAAGKLLWAVSQTRPDMAFQGCQISNAGNNATVKTLIDTNKAIRKMRTEQMEIRYPPLGQPKDIEVIVYADGSHGALPSGNSQGAAIVFLQGAEKSAPITWRSKKIERVTKSPLATEVSAVADGSDLGHLVASMTKEVFHLKQMPRIQMRTDSKSLRDHMETTRVIKDPRLRVDTARLRQMNERQEVEIVWVPGAEMLADCMTKKAAATDKLRKALTTGVLPEVLQN